VICEELYNVKALILENLILPTNEIKITVFKPSPLNANLEPVIIA